MKKLQTLALALTGGAILFSGVATLSGCKDKAPAHTHSYDSEITYSVEGEKAYTVKDCACGESNKTEITNAVIVNNDSAHDILKGDISNKTIVFTGEIENVIEIRPFAEDRSLENITFAATEDCTFKNFFVIEATNGTTQTKTPIGETTYSEPRTQSNLNAENLTFTNLNFDGHNARLFFAVWNSTNFSNLTIKNCTFKGEYYEAVEGKDHDGKDYDFSVNGYKHYDAAIGINFNRNLYDSTTNKNVANNILVENCKVEDHFQGIYISHCDNVTIKNNSTKNTVHNGISVHSYTDGTGYYFTGNISILNNRIENCTGYDGNGERAIRFGYGKNANIIISGNTFINATDSDNEIIKSQNGMIDCTLTLSNNSFDGTLIDDSTYDLEDSSKVTCILYSLGE